MSHGDLYPQHLATLDRDLGKALEQAARGGAPVEAVVFHSGRQRVYHADDKLIPFEATPHFRRWVPLAGPEHLVLARPGHKPRVVRVAPKDFWYDTEPAPISYWEQSVDLLEVATFAEAVDAIGSLTGAAYVGGAPEAAAELGIETDRVEPPALMAPLDWYRAYKTEHEVAMLRVAAEKAAAGHAAARDRFLGGASEIELHRMFLEVSDQLEGQVPYETIVAQDEKSAILHYQHKRGAGASSGQTFLLDAGAACEGYAADITRTWTRAGVHEAFQVLVRGVDALERDLVAMVTPGRPYLEIHVQAHRAIADLLSEVGVVDVSGEEAFERGLTRPFFPHGVGHQLGLQVHDVGGHQAGPDGGRVPPPEEYPFLRNTRIVEEGHVLTIEPGLYFIPMLLDELRAEELGKAVRWDLVDQLVRYGGIRIEDNIVCTADGPYDFTRDLIEGP